jgi:hypothetical protein
MSARERKLRGEIRRRLRELHAAHAEGIVLAASADVPGREDLRQTVSVLRSPAGTALVRVHEYDDPGWDAEPETTETEFPDLGAALSWLEAGRGVHWSMLHEPGTAPARTLDTWPRSDM